MIFTETGMSGEEIQDTTDFFISYSARKLGLSDHDAWAWMLMPLPILAGCSPCSLVSGANGDILIFLIDAMEKKDEMEIQKVGAYFAERRENAARLYAKERPKPKRIERILAALWG